MGKVSKYQAQGFYLLSELDAGGLLTWPAAAVNIKKGDALHDNASGFATNTATDFASTFIGIANEDVDNSGGAAGDLNIQIVPPLPHYRWIVPVDNALITATARGSLCDLGSANNKISLADNPTEGWAFFVDEIDASTDAVDGNTYGYAIGRLLVIGTAA